MHLAALAGAYHAPRKIFRLLYSKTSIIRVYTAVGTENAITLSIFDHIAEARYRRKASGKGQLAIGCKIKKNYFNDEKNACMSIKIPPFTPQSQFQDNFACSTIFATKVENGACWAYTCMEASLMPGCGVCDRSAGAHVGIGAGASAFPSPDFRDIVEELHAHVLHIPTRAEDAPGHTRHI